MSQPRPKLTVSIQGIPEAIWSMRQEMARILREGAQDEEPRVAARLRAIASQFEAGVVDEGALDNPGAST